MGVKEEINVDVNTDVKTSVLARYSEGAKARQESLCCPVDYDASLLKILPQEIIDRDYGCGDPSRYVRPGDTVLDLGSGGGKICYMAAQLVGDDGYVIGVDMNDDMLALARKHQSAMADKLGGERVDFRKGYIQDLSLSLEALQAWLAAKPVKDVDDLQALDAWKLVQKAEQPLVESASVDLVVSNCVLNLVAESDRKQMIDEIFRVLKPGGRVAISDIVADEPVPAHLRDDPTLWSGCISGAFVEKAFIDAFIDAGFIGVAFDKWDATPWQEVEGIEFRSVTLTASKPLDKPALDQKQAVIYKGPFSEVYDDAGRVYPRGVRIAVSDRYFEMLTQGPYKDAFIGIEPARKPAQASGFCKASGTVRPVAETKGGVHGVDDQKGGCC